MMVVADEIARFLASSSRQKNFPSSLKVLFETFLAAATLPVNDKVFDLSHTKG
jgi:hypothetical protein